MSRGEGSFDSKPNFAESAAAKLVLPFEIRAPMRAFARAHRVIPADGTMRALASWTSSSNRAWAVARPSIQKLPYVPPAFSRIQPPQFPGSEQPPAEPDAATGWFQCGNARGS